MAEPVDVIFTRGLGVFTEVIEQLAPDQWERASPCSGWTALDLLGHVSAAVDAGVTVMSGGQPEWAAVERPADLVEGEPTEFWNGKAQRARAAVAGADLGAEVETPFGARTVAARLAFPAVDLFVHAWDIGRAADVDVEIPDDVIDLGYTLTDGVPEEVVRKSGQVFGPEVEPPPDATPTERFVAWTGRNPR